MTNNNTSRQMDLLLSHEGGGSVPLHQTAVARLGFELDSRDWLSFLADEWWPLMSGRSDLRLGVGAVFNSADADSRMKVVVWVDPLRLPDCHLPVFREGAWVNAAVRSIRPTDSEVVWPGVLPLSSVTAFAAASANERARLTAMAKGFQNLELGDRAIEVEVEAVRRIAPASVPPRAVEQFCPPVAWDALRGAAAMAVWAVPSIDPWLDVFIESISPGPGHRHAAALGAPWLNRPIWSRRKAKDAPALWMAILDVFSRVNYREDWRPQDLLDLIVDKAVHCGADVVSMDDLGAETRKLLLDEAVIDQRRSDRDPLGFALQLVLLRPKPENFIGWIDALPSMSPAVWWTGAMLCGFVTGFRDLEMQFRGSSLSRDLLAIRTWNLASENSDNDMPWPDTFSSAPEWHLTDDRVQFTDGERVWAERKSSRRGEWFRADYSEPQVHQQAFDLAKRFAPSAVRRCLRLKDTVLQGTGEGKLSLDRAGKRLTVKGWVEFTLSDDIVVVDDLDVDSFRDWLAVGSVGERLPSVPKTLFESPSPEVADTHLPVDSNNVQKSTPVSFDMPSGLLLFPEFVSEQEEMALLAEVDRSAWRTDLSRRVQQYGWKYDYKARKVEQSAYLGPLPAWAQRIATRLVDQGLVQQMPDQVIVNEYVENQGISKHVDCMECFPGAVVTVSLGESWGMLFRNNDDGSKVEHVLGRRSAAVLTGDAREKWTHEIPKRKKEGNVVRRRRVSLTFRKVRSMPAEPERVTGKTRRR
jgi:alkylated DNA repair dioxygenase AlkB